MSLSERDQWEREIINLLIERLEISNGDSQGLVEANSWKITQEWSKGSTSSVAADRLIKL